MLPSRRPWTLVDFPSLAHRFLAPHSTTRLAADSSGMTRACSLDALPPVVAASAVIATLVACFSIARSRGRYLGGLDWPYFSDLGRDSPGYEVFCAGLSAVAIALVLTWWRNLLFQRRLVARQLQEVAGDAEEKEASASASSVRSLSVAGASLAIASALGLPVLAFFSTSSYPDVHQYAAYWFFVLEAVALVVNVSALLVLAVVLLLTKAPLRP